MAGQRVVIKKAVIIKHNVFNGLIGYKAHRLRVFHKVCVLWDTFFRGIETTNRHYYWDKQ